MSDEADSLRRRALNLVRSITGFLYQNQCILKTIHVEAESTAQKLRFTRGAEPVEIRFDVSQGKLAWICGANAGSAPPGARFRINPFQGEPQHAALDLPKQESVSKVARLRRYGAQILRHWKLGGYDRDTKSILNEVYGNLKRESRDTGAGFLARWKPSSDDSAFIEVLDFGGILDDNPNVEGAAFGPRVMANYYADGYAAYLFLREYLDGARDRKWLEACNEVLEFIARSYAGYPKGVAWYHHEFKNPAVLECLVLMDANSIEVPQMVRDLLSRMHVDSYEPTNVFALRLYWKGLLAKIVGTADAARIQECRDRLSKDATADGLILDENPPAYCGARDLTYHQYSLACLAGYLTHCDDPEMEELFKAGCAWTVKTRLPNGELSYNGRGANNIYHLAAACYALLFAHERFGTEVGDLSATLSLLERWLAEDRSLPTGMNAYGQERMGWNHCRTPYNALSAYYLLLASDILAKHPDIRALAETPLAEVPEIADLSDSGYAVFRTRRYTWVLFSGVRESYVYSNANQTGISGTAAICPKAGNPINLILNRSLRVPATLCTDLPSFIIDGRTFDPIGGDLRVATQSATWSYASEAFVFVRSYSFEADRVLISNRLEMKQGTKMSINRWIALPLHTDSYSYEIAGAALKIEERSRKALKFELHIHQDSYGEGWVEESIVSNPRGRGVIMKRSIAEKLISKGALFEASWEVRFHE